MKTNPKNIPEIEAALITAEASLKVAQTAKVNVKTLASSLSVEDWKTQNSEVKTFKKAVVDTQQAYTHVIRDFKQTLAALKKSVE
jgi:hypothetical protein